ncbi:MAG TPA: hypothetical protein ENJ53_09085 [Phaeodactylibacter sp.]|nr:hypothetical protein [Phaeodactylibacter sp.]
MKKVLNLSCILMLFVFQAKANFIQGNPEFSVQVSQSSVLLGNDIEVTFMLKNAEGKQFEAPQFEGFDIVGGPNQSTSISIINGMTTQSSSYSYLLKPTKTGTFFIPPAFIEVDGKTLETQPIEILVLENPDGIVEKPKRIAPHQMGGFNFPKGNFFNFPNDDFFNFPNDDFFNFPKIEIPKNKNQQGEQQNATPKKKRKVYRI